MLQQKQILIVGAGPIGLVLAYQLSRLGVRCTLFEKSHTLTAYPKMDYTNSRSMELLHLLGLADAYRAQPGAVPETVEFESVFVTGFRPEDKVLGSWSVESVADQKAESRRVNDGTFSVKPGQRCSQVVFETWMRDVVGRLDGVDFRVGWEYIGHEEDEEAGNVKAFFQDEHGQKQEVAGAYLVGCDGGRSRVRKTARICMVGRSLPTRFYLVHFRSAQLAQSPSFGRFWHAFPIGSGFIINQDNQDNQDTFTAHYLLPADDSGTSEAIDPHDIIYKTLGGFAGPHQITIDSILVHGRWQTSFGIADSYTSSGGRTLLAGDAAHWNPPPGGYGMNSGNVDAFDLGWRLAAMVKGYGGPLLLSSYSLERRCSMIRALLRSHRHSMEHVKLGELCAENIEMPKSETQEGRAVRAKIESSITLSGPDTKDFGLELDLRNDFSPCIVPDGTVALPWDVNVYVPSTRPGSRAPHVFLKDGGVSVYDLFGKEWTLMQFVNGNGEDVVKVDALLELAEELRFPLKHFVLQEDEHVRRLWQRNLVLVRPDAHVAWRGNEAPDRDEEEQILLVGSGRMAVPGYQEPLDNEDEKQFIKTVAAFGIESSDRARELKL
ncbi:FAD binding domain-containing protein [Aspergillus germanicus]